MLFRSWKIDYVSLFLPFDPFLYPFCIWRLIRRKCIAIFHIQKILLLERDLSDDGVTAWEKVMQNLRLFKIEKLQNN